MMYIRNYDGVGRNVVGVPLDNHVEVLALLALGTLLEAGDVGVVDAGGRDT